MTLDHTEKELHGFKGFIAYDDDPQDPNEWSYPENFLGGLQTNRVKLGHPDWGKSDARRYIPYGEGPWEYSEENSGYLGLDRDTYVDSEEELRQYWETECGTGYEVFPVEYLDHGSNGGEIRRCDHESADGYIFIKVPWASELEKLAHPGHDADAIAEGLIEDWNTYLSGDVHWVRIEDSDGEMIDSCGGVYGWKAAEELLDEMAEAHQDQTRKVSVVRIHGSEMLPFPHKAHADILEIEVPLWLGDDALPRWAVTEGPFKDDPDVLQIDIYRGPCQTSAEAAKEVANG